MQIFKTNPTANYTHRDLKEYRQNHINKAARLQPPPNVLSPETVHIIRRLHAKGMTCAGISRGMNVSRSQVSRIVNHKTYKNV